MSSQKKTNIEFASTKEILNQIVSDFMQRGLPVRRLSPLVALLIWGNAWEGDSELCKNVCSYLLQNRRPDGGWVDCEDTAWSLFVLDYFYQQASSCCLEKTRNWLLEERSGQGWGYARRDNPNIPISALVRICCPLLADDPSATWLRRTWEQDLQSKYQLSYKAAWFLLGRGDTEEDRTLALRTLRHLEQDQRKDGGWGPWREHYAPTDCFATGIILSALGREPLAEGSQGEAMATKAIKWAQKICNESGLFPTHYIELNSAWMLNGLLSCSSRWQL